MAERDGDERDVEQAVAAGLKSWLAKVRDAVMAPFRQHGLQPNPGAISQLDAAWRGEVDTIVSTLSRVADRSWNNVAGSPAVSRHAFVMSQLAQTENFLVRIPDEVYNLVFAEIADGVNAGESVPQVAQRVDKVLDWSGSENWPNRARVIARTEVTRANNAGTMGAGTEVARVTGKVVSKTWHAHSDDRTRTDHRVVDGQTVPFYQPFQVGTNHLMFPGDPAGPPDEVINCRCHMTIGEPSGRH
jgi:uncharacterized protein with gpF-like domain